VTTIDELRPARPAARAVAPDRWGSPWPLVVLLAGFPVWWALGLSIVMVFVCATAMAVQLVRRQRAVGDLVTPPHFGVLVLLVAWVCLGLPVLWADAPGAVPGGGGASRVLVFAYRAGWYVAALVFLLWIVNIPARVISTRRVMSLLSWLFVVTVAGGFLGVLAPGWEFTSPFELLLPGALSSNDLVSSIVHPEASDVQDVLGSPEPRPKAPFPYANTWGSALGILLPFLVITWGITGRRWQRVVTVVVLTLSVVPIVASLNRALWAALLLAMVIAVAQMVLRGRWWAAVLLGLGLTLAAVVFSSSDLSETVTQRLDNPHSNDRRGELLALTTRSTAEGSPLVGFGSTRDVQGSFNSIAGGSRPGCESCGVPPLGTQGHLWMLIFSQGFVGAALFVWFLLAWLARTWRSRSLPEAAAALVIVMFLVFVPVYDTLDVPILVLVLAIGLAWRAQRERLRREASGLPWHELTTRVRSAVAPVLVCAAALGALGLVAGLAQPARHQATTDVLLAPEPEALDSSELSSIGLPPESTIDTEAALMVADRTLAQATGDDSEQVVADLQERLQVTAPPNTDVLEVTVVADDPESAERTSAAVAEAYLDNRRDYLETRRTQTLAALREALGDLDPDEAALSTEEEYLRVAIEDALVDVAGTSVVVGEVVAAPVAGPVRRQLEVPTTSGVGLGLLVGLGWAGLRRRFGTR
jgi:hypothetical protein